MFRYAATIFLSAFLLFSVQPLIGKYILPWFGGGSGVWTTCMLFFQIVLLLGYAYAHGLNRLCSPSWQSAVHLVVLLGCLAFLPIIPSSMWQPQSAGNPTLRILLLLTTCLAAPYFALSTTGPLLQAWFSRTYPTRSPYRLYALSNAGSLIGLVGYPFVFEPLLTRKLQTIAWSIGFALFALLCGWCALARNASPPSKEAHGSIPRTDETRKLRPRQTGQRQPRHKVPKSDSPHVARHFTIALWIALPACASTMLLAVTSQLSQEITPVPFLWVLPLATYLLTFIIAFEWPRIYFRPVFLGLLVIAPWIVVGLLLEHETGLIAQVSLYMVVLFACCMACHGELYRHRPQAERLTGYYLAIAAGGALGGAFVSIAAPLLFYGCAEFYIGLFGSFALMLASQFTDPASIFHRGRRRLGWLTLIAVVLGAGFLIQMTLASLHKDTAIQTRNFFGIMRIRYFSTLDDQGYMLKLEHGRITHGAQIFHKLIPDMQRRPTMYFGPHTGVGIVLRKFPKVEHRRVAVVGLGVGTLAAYGQPGDVFRFYEINPEVKRFADTYFTYLKDSPATVDVVLGDARLSLEREESQHFDVMALDAFSGDAIPTHLLTKEAFETYVRHLEPDGVIAVHITNRYLDLFPIVHRLGIEFGFTTVFVMSDPDPPNLVEVAHWVLLTRNAAFLNDPELVLLKEQGFWPQGMPKVSLWTDDYCSLLEIARWTQPEFNPPSD